MADVSHQTQKWTEDTLSVLSILNGDNRRETDSARAKQNNEYRRVTERICRYNKVTAKRIND